MITVTIWHNTATGAQGRQTALIDGYQPCHPMVRVFAYQADPAGRAPEAIAEEAFAICNGHPRDASGSDLSRRYYARELRSLSVGDVVAGDVPLAVARAGWTLVRGGLNEVRTDEHGTHPLPASAAPGRTPPGLHREGVTSMTVLESRDYQAARERIKGNPIIAIMAAGVMTVPLGELAHEDGTPRSGFMLQANRTFDDAEAGNADNPSYQPYPPDAHRHLGLIAEAILAERAAMREAVGSAMAAPGTDPESTQVTRIIKRLRAGESPVDIARQTGAIAPSE